MSEDLNIKGRLTNNLQCQNSAEVVAHQSSLRISYKFHILEILESLESYLICIVNTTDCISSVQPQTFFCVILFV